MYELDVALTYGCNACGDSPYIVFRAADIKEQGVVTYESNCTFKQQYISCNSEPYILELAENYKTCQLYIPSFNKTLIVDINYLFKGELSPLRIIISKDTPLEALKSLATDSSFVDTLTKTALTCTIIGTVNTILIKLTRIFMMTKVERQVSEA